MQQGKSLLRKNILFIILFFALLGWAGILCLYHLGEAGTHNWDEARHVANAYEMMHSNNWWVSTYLGEIDYFNYKPPLSMWCIILCFRIFGISSYTMRLYSAVAMMLLFVILDLFVAKNMGRRAAVISGILFVSGKDLFFFHMGRSADADALYLLLFTAAMLCLYQTEKKPWFLTGYGVFISLAFMAKCFHVAIGLAIFVCYMPRLYKKLRFKHYFGAILGGMIPAGIWVLARFSYDGLTFFRGMLGQEVISRIEREKNYFGYLHYFITNPVIVISLIAVLIGIVVLKAGKEKRNISMRLMIESVIGHDLYLFILWLFIPLLVYSASGAFMEWYSYICYLPFYVIAGAVLGRASAVQGKNKWAGRLLLLAPVVGLVISGDKSISRLKTLKYENNTDIRIDLASLIEDHPDYRGAKIYIENSRNEYKLQNIWEQNNVVDAYIAGDLEPINGGVPLFLEDRESILIISKDLFETYSDSLTGRVILVDGNDYLVFSNEFYG